MEDHCKRTGKTCVLVEQPGALRYRQIEYHRMPLTAYLALDDPLALTRNDFIRLGLVTGAGPRTVQAVRDGSGNVVVNMGEEHQLAPGALKQLAAQRQLQLLQRGTGGRLRKRYGLCGRHRGTALGHGAEDLELTQGEMQHDDDSYIRIDDSRLAPAHPAHD